MEWDVTSANVLVEELVTMYLVKIILLFSGSLSFITLLLFCIIRWTTSKFQQQLIKNTFFHSRSELSNVIHLFVFSTSILSVFSH